ncbi:MAG: M20/M25/M40 family metallo-hydrolase [Desulfovibrio sp.]|jgi:succinyl-diaminopimelate desuccinylase|nr:M20/M25/M40 family metallo-hydrolase [Desulfovibrio sp.]
MSAATPDVIELAQNLVRSNTIIGGKGERQTLEFLAGLLQEAGFSCVFDSYDANNADRVSLIARLCPDDTGKSLFFGGHIDTVPLGGAPWKHDPFDGCIRDEAIYGRGSCDMKGGVAAYVCAALSAAPRLRGRDLVLHIYGGEEIGCHGSFHLMKSPELYGNPGAGIIAEPTANQPLSGHKGALWLAFETNGRTSHSSMPEQGDNALAKLLPAANRLLGAAPKAEHILLGSCTMALTSLHSGLNANSIPDKAVLTMDMRTVPGQDHARLVGDFAALAGTEVLVKSLIDLQAVWTNPYHPWCVGVRRLLASFLGAEPGIACIQYFTDAAAARALFPDLPLLIMGPGDPAMAHKTDEACPLQHIRSAQAIYEALIRDWYELD